MVSVCMVLLGSILSTPLLDRCVQEEAISCLAWVTPPEGTGSLISSLWTFVASNPDEEEEGDSSKNLIGIPDWRREGDANEAGKEEGD